MQKSYSSFLALISLLSTLCIYTTHEQPVVVHVHNHNSSQADSKPQNYALSKNNIDITQLSEQKVIHSHEINLHLAEYFKPLAESYTQKSSTLISYIQSAIEHKLKTTFCLLCIGYGYLYYEICNTHKLLNEATSWCNWKQAVTLQHLSTAKYDDLIQQLLIDVQKKYLFASHNSTQAISHEYLIQELLHEKKMLLFYQSILHWTQKLYCSKLLPLTISSETISEKLARLDFVIDLFSTWQSKQH